MGAQSGGARSGTLYERDWQKTLSQFGRQAWKIRQTRPEIEKSEKGGDGWAVLINEGR